MHPFSILTLGIFLAGYITARWDLVRQLYELAIFAWDHGVVSRALKGFAILSVVFVLIVIPLERIATREAEVVRHSLTHKHNRSLHLHSTREYSAVAFLRGSSFEDAGLSSHYGTMTTRNALMRIFWPSDAPKGDYPGVLVGWRNSELDILVVTILQHVELRKVVNALQVEALYRNPPHPLEHIFDRCGGSRLQVLGSVNSQSPPNSFDPQQIFVETRKNGRFPQVYCPADCEITLQIISFDRPHPTRMQYMSLEPISLALGDKSENATAGGATPFDKIDSDERSERQRKKELVEKLKQHTVVKHPRTQKEIHLPRILNQINCSYEMAALLQKNVGLVGARPKRSLSVSERVVESAQNAYTYVLVLIWHILTVWVYPVALQLFILGLMALRIAAELVLRVLEWRLTSESPALKDTSATAQQVDIRLQQFCYWPIQYLTLLRRRADWESITTNHPEYIRFFNSLWLVANDVIIGIALGSYIIENANFVGSQVDTVLGTWSIEGLSRIITWLMDWPAGLKLNTELAAFLGDLFLWVIDYWGGKIVSIP
ncbi:MAG: phosphatidylinositol N-acetylglucosaminyltransferase subunit gpi1 [Bathelium mastoideum]|nr:MAG: phosphatidylinositol N-acetylglucosaminyltransferase subunit gpi1 [Bathelium mastoideum]